MNIKEISVEKVTSTIKKLCIEANTVLEEDVIVAYEKNLEKKNPWLGKMCYSSYLKMQK